MGDILGIGVTHYPPLLSRPETYANLMRIVLNSPMVPPEMRQPANWPEPMQEEYAHEPVRAVQHQERMVEAFRQVRRAIDDFGPDAVIIFGDDQYENFKEDCIPPFCVFMHDQMESRPFAHGLLGFGGENNVWGEPARAERRLLRPARRVVAGHFGSTRRQVCHHGVIGLVARFSGRQAPLALPRPRRRSGTFGGVAPGATPALGSSDECPDRCSWGP